MEALEGMLMGMMNKQGIDPALLMAMKEDNDGMFGGSGMLVLLFLIIMMGGFGGNRGGMFGGSNDVVAQTDFRTLMEAINNNGMRQEMAINKLSTDLNVDSTAIKSALCNLDKGLAMLDGKIGYSTAEMKNAIQQCCCNMQLAVERGNAGIAQQLCTLEHGLERQMFGLESGLNSRLCALENHMGQQFNQTQQLILTTNYENRIRELEGERLELSQDKQTAEILKAIKCEPKRHIFEESLTVNPFGNVPFGAFGYGYGGYGGYPFCGCGHHDRDRDRR